MIKKIGLSNSFQKFILKTRDKKYLDKLNRNLPIIEALSATSLYLIANQSNKKIPKERKVSLNYQTAIGGIMGATLAKIVDSWANKHKNILCNNLKKLNIRDSEKVIAGAKIAVPLVITSFITRYLLSTASVPLANIASNIQRKST